MTKRSFTRMCSVLFGCTIAVSCGDMTHEVTDPPEVCAEAPIPGPPDEKPSPPDAMMSPAPPVSPPAPSASTSPSCPYSTTSVIGCSGEGCLLPDPGAGADGLHCQSLISAPTEFVLVNRSQRIIYVDSRNYRTWLQPSISFPTPQSRRRQTDLCECGKACPEPEGLQPGGGGEVGILALNPGGEITSEELLQPWVWVPAVDEHGERCAKYLPASGVVPVRYCWFEGDGLGRLDRPRCDETSISLGGKEPRVVELPVW